MFATNKTPAGHLAIENKVLGLAGTFVAHAIVEDVSGELVESYRCP